MNHRLPVVVRVKRKRDLAPVDTILVEAEESHAAKRRARDAALAAELDAALTGAFGRPERSDDAAAGGTAGTTATEACGAEHASVPLGGGGGGGGGGVTMRPARRRFQRVKMTLSVADARDEGRVQELVQTVMATSRKRGQAEAGIQLAAAADAATTTPSAPTSGLTDAASSIASRGKGTTDADADADADEKARAPLTKRVTRLDRAPDRVGVGTGGTGGGSSSDKPDAMSDYFRMYDLVCNEEEEEEEEGEEKKGREKSGPARKLAGRGLQRGRRGAGATSEAGASAAAGSGGGGEDEEEQMAAKLMCDYMPMLREYLGDGTGAADEKVDHHPAADGDAYVYDVYVQVEDDAYAYADTAVYADDGGERLRGEGGGGASVIYVGGQDTELFFDAMDGLVDDERDDDGDSQDSNREDAPGADYPDEEEEDDSEDEDEWDDDGGDSDGPRRRMEGFYHPSAGGDRNAFYGGGEDSDGGDFYDDDDGSGPPGVSGYRPSASSHQYRETAYDPEFDDVTDDNYYS